ncbi:MAG: hypothetical protein EAZ57_08880 [Cytophagales bacterium]|nr:MAG: hypothetical protein EAZ67_09690 [Cytophagales bacterium]TAF60014.1 MAG: hypothetical protein EAZ57_08880 [Cytophagales bacterium]
MRFLKFFLALFALALWQKGSYAQVELKFNRVKLPGLVTSVTALAQDKTGYIWIGTELGLVRFDGKNTKQYVLYKTDTVGHPKNAVSSLFVDSKQRLWVGTYGSGAYLFNPETSTFKNLYGKRGDSTTLNSNLVFGFTEDLDNNIWISAGGLCLVDEAKWCIKKKLAPRQEQESDQQPAVYSNGIAAQDRTGRFWMGTWRDNYGVDTFRAPFKKFYHLQSHDDTLKFPEQKTPQLVKDVFVDSKNDVWFCTYIGLYWYHQKTGLFSWFRNQLNNPQSLNADNVSCITEDKEGNIWVGALGGGLSMLDPKTQKFVSYTHNHKNSSSIPHNNVSALLIDKDGRLWVGTSAGLAYINPLMRHFKILTHKVPGLDDFVTGGRQIAEAADGTIWSALQKGIDHLGATYGGLLGIHPKTGKYLHYKPSKSSDKSARINDLYLSCMDNAPGNKVAFCYTKEEVMEIDGFSIKPKPQWSGSEDGFRPMIFLFNSYDEMMRFDIRGTGNFSIWEPGQRTYRKLKTKASIEGLNKIFFYEDEYRNTWGLNKVDTLFRYDRQIKDFVKISIPENSKRNDIQISGACAHAPDQIWISSSLGLQLVDTKTGDILKSITAQEGLSDTRVLSLLKDKEGFIWASTALGLSKIDPKSFKIDNFLIERDLPVSEIYSDPIGRGTYAIGKYSGMFYYRTNEGILFFDPALIKSSANTSQLVFTGLRIMGDEVDSRLLNNQSITVEAGADMIAIDFTLLNYFAPELNTYEYQLLGFDKKMIKAETSNTATYTNLPPGSYTFRVWGKDGRGVPAPKYIEITIVKEPYIWQTLLFRVVVVLLIISITSAIVYWRVRALNKANAVLEQKVTERTAEVVKQKDEISQIATNLSIAIEESNALNEELSITLDQLKDQATVIEQKNYEIVSSINYAKRIQFAMLPDLTQKDELRPGFWTFFRPRDIVSGDFYWLHSIKNPDCHAILVAVVDCTGHGVSGALMSMIGHNLLDEIVNAFAIHSPETIINQLNTMVKRTLRQQDTEVRDGMEIGLLSFKVSTQNNKKACSDFKFASAGRPLCILGHDNKISIVAPDTMPVGGHERKHEKLFELKNVPTTDIKRLYLFSDGYQDQFGGARNKRYTKKRLYELLEKSSALDFESQAKVLEQAFDEWMQLGKERQIDDVLVMGIDFEEFEIS